MRDACCAAARSLTRFNAETPMQRLLADNAAAGMLGMARALNGLTGVIDPRDVGGVKGMARLRVADWMPAFVNAARVLVAVGAISLFWIASAWPNGVAAITFCAVIVILLPLRRRGLFRVGHVSPGNSDLRRSSPLSWCSGSSRERRPSRVSVSSWDLVLVPFGFLNARARYPLFTFAAAVNFLPMLNITNGMNYDASQFWNGAIAILAGIAVGVVAMLVIPPLSPAIRARRLLALTLADLRRLARRASPGRQDDWESRGVARLLAMPDKPSRSSAPSSPRPSPSARRSCAFATSPRGSSRARSWTRRLSALAEGRSGEAIERLKEIDRRLAALPRARSGGRILLEPQGQHPGDFGSALRIRLLFRPADPMRFNEINLFGLYVAPIAVILGVAWVIYLFLRRAGDRFGYAAGLASGAVRACALCYHRLVDRPHDRALGTLMSGVELKASDVRALARRSSAGRSCRPSASCRFL